MRSRILPLLLRHIPAQLVQVHLSARSSGDEAEELRNRGGDGGEYGATTTSKKCTAVRCSCYKDTAVSRALLKWLSHSIRCMAT